MADTTRKGTIWQSRYLAFYTGMAFRWDKFAFFSESYRFFHSTLNQSRISQCLSIYKEKEIYSKGLAHVMMQSAKSQDTQSAIWILRRALGGVPIWKPGAWRPRSWSPKAGKDFCPRPRQSGGRNSSHSQERRLFIPLRSSVDREGPAHTEEGGLLSSPTDLDMRSHPQMPSQTHPE